MAGKVTKDLDALGDPLLAGLDARSPAQTATSIHVGDSMTSASERDADPLQPKPADGGARLSSTQRLAEAPDSGVGRSYVGAVGVIVVASIVVAAMTFAVYALVAMWPTSASTAATPSHVIGIRLLLDEEQRLFVIVALAGFLGGLVHSARSLYEYVGNRVLRRSWLLMYLALPFIGGALAVVFYIILRGGLITGTAAQVNFFGFAAISALVGLFSPEAAEKLKQIFSTLLAPDPPGRDRLTSSVAAMVESVEPESGAVGTTIRIRGRNLSDATAVIFPHARVAATVISDTEVSAVVPEGATTGRIYLVVGELIVNAPGEFRVEA
jgi:IPT/TIG domain